MCPCIYHLAPKPFFLSHARVRHHHHHCALMYQDGCRPPVLVLPTHHRHRRRRRCFHLSKALMTCVCIATMSVLTAVTAVRVVAALAAAIDRLYVYVFLSRRGL